MVDGGSILYTDQTICTFHMLKGLFNLPLLATQGSLDSLFGLMNVPLRSPAYDTKACHGLILRKGATACITDSGRRDIRAMMRCWSYAKEGQPTGKGHPVIINARWRRRRCHGSSS